MASEGLHVYHLDDGEEYWIVAEDDPEIDFTALPVGATVSRVQDYPVVTATCAAWAAWGGPGAMVGTTICP